jgi:formate hydrogenlyase subunit 3/multisubunit Na+/H+ antiporter MnhD subunit
MVLLGAGLGLPASWQLLVGVSTVLSTLTLFVAWTQCQHLRILDVRSYWRAAPTLLVLLAVAGFPLTIGFPARVAVYWSVYDQEKWLSLLSIIVAEALFLGALLRVLLELECVLDPTLQNVTEDRAGNDETVRGRWRTLFTWARRVNWQREIGYGAGALLALGIVILGVSPPLLSTPSLGTWFGLPVLQMWAALLLPAIGAGLVYRARDRILDVMETWWPLAQRVLSLDWLYKGIETVLSHLGAVVWGGALVVEGAGYMAWVVLACLLIVLFVIAR